MRSLLVTVGALLPALSLSWGCTSCKRFAYEGFGRDSWQQPQEVVRTLAIQPGAVVADIGAGGGYFTFRLADAVGPSGKVYAVDIDPGMVEYLQQRATEDGYRNVDVVLATPDDPHLPPGGVDLVFTCNTYHHFDNPTTYFAAMKKYLRPGGRVAIIDSRPEGFWHRLFGHATAEDAIEKDMQAAGYQLAHEYDFLPNQNFLVFAPNAG
jgi:arsenite methyltransferase